MRQSPTGILKASSESMTESHPTAATIPPAQPPVLKTGRDLTPTNGLIATGKIEGLECRIVIDTGSNVSIVSPAFLQKCPSLVAVEPVESSLRTVTGDTAPIQGNGQLKIPWVR